MNKSENSTFESLKQWCIKNNTILIVAGVLTTLIIGVLLFASNRNYRARLAQEEKLLQQKILRERNIFRRVIDYYNSLEHLGYNQTARIAIATVTIISLIVLLGGLIYLSSSAIAYLSSSSNSKNPAESQVSTTTATTSRDIDTTTSTTTISKK